ncbi:MAG: hypothetical protein ACI9CP_000826 [Cryomorphaceae bacterium]
MRPIALLFVFSIVLLGLKAQESASIYGLVSDSLSGVSLPGATVYIPSASKGIAADLEGRFDISLKPGTYEVRFSYAGYNPTILTVSLEEGESKALDIGLSNITLQQVEIKAYISDYTSGTAMGRTRLDMETIKLLPAFLGEVDLLKTIQLLPGVQAAGEGSSGFYVRGGGPDQNLILFDDAVVYNASHLLGFFSVFNSDAIEEVELYKGGMPAEYGERLASVINISQRKGSTEKFQGRGGLGVISSRLTLEGPLIKNKASFIFSGRRTYIDALITPFVSEESDFGGSQYFFYDLNGRLDWDLGKGSSVYLSGYFGDDAFDFNSPQTEFKTNVTWGNRIVSAGYQKIINDDVLLKVNGSFTKYNFGFTGSQDEFLLQVNSQITDYRLKPQLSFKLGNHHIKTGFSYVFHDISPNNSSAEQGETIFDLGEQQQFYSHEGALYISDEFDLTDVWKVEAGLRVSAFAHTGPFTRYILDENGSKQDTISYGSGETIADYIGWEPRFSSSYRLSEKASVKASFTQNYQYIHLANLSPLALPTDVWLPSTELVQPQLGRQYAVGYFRLFDGGNIEASVEAYYKEMENLIEYKENTQPSDGVDNNEDNLLTFGRGESYGIEFFVKKNFGKTTGWIGYTLSRTERQFDAINRGQWFPATFDRTHDISVVAAHQLTDKWTVSGTFVFGTGRAITLPVSGYFIENTLVYNYSDRNSFRMRDYHRMDLSATYSTSQTKTITDKVTGEIIGKRKRIQSQWVFSIYNVYNRLNPYFYYFDNQGEAANGTFQVQAKQVSLFPILPAVTWNFQF